MKITTNLPETNIRTIGHAGFDVITLIGFDLPCGIYEEPVIEHCSKNDDGTWGKGIEDCKGISCTKRKVTIYGNATNGKLIYKLHFGNQKNRSFMYLEIHSRIKHPTDNIENMKVEDVWDSLKYIIKDIKSKYDINIQYQDENIRIKSAEINKTFPINGEFKDYKRIFDIYRYILSQTKKTSKKTKIGEFGSQTSVGTTSETNYLMKGETVEVICYDKGVETADESGHPFPIDYDINLMRMEIKCLEQSMLRLSSNTDSFKTKRVYLIDVTDDNISAFYHEYFKHMLDNADLYLDEQISIKENEAFNPLFLHISASSLLYILNNDASFAEKLITDNYVQEQESHLPSILDISDYIAFIKKLPLNGEIQDLFIDQFNSIIANPSRYNVACRKYINQRILYDSLRKSLLMDKVYVLGYTLNYELARICFVIENKGLPFTTLSTGETIYCTNNKNGILFKVNEVKTRANTKRNPGQEVLDHLEYVYLSKSEYNALCALDPYDEEDNQYLIDREEDRYFFEHDEDESFYMN